MLAFVYQPIMERKSAIAEKSKILLLLAGPITGSVIGLTQIEKPSAVEAPGINQKPMTLQLDNPLLAKSDQPQTNVDEVLNRVLNVNVGFQETFPNQQTEEEPQEPRNQESDFAWWLVALAVAGAAAAGLAGVALRRRIVS